MKQFRILLLVFLLFFLIVLTPSNSYAEGEMDLLPGNPVKSPSYIEYERDDYIIDYAPPTSPGTLDGVYFKLLSLLNSLLNLIWSIYLYIIELVIRLVNLGYNTALFDKLFLFLDAMMPKIIQSIWNPLWFLVAGVGIFTVILLWVMGNLNRSLMALSSILLMVAFTPIFMTSLPSYLSLANELSTTITGELTGRMMNNGQAYMANQKRKMLQKEKNINKELEKLNQNNTLPKSYVKHRQDELSNQYKRLILAIDIPTGQKYTTSLTMHVVNDMIWDTVVKQPYYIINFGSVNAGKKYFDYLMQYGTDENSRLIQIRKWAKIDEKTGVAANENFLIFTTAGFGLRYFKLLIATLYSLIPLFLIISMAVSILIWKAKSIGRAIFLIFDALMSLYPGFGVSHVIRGIVQTFSAFLMVLFYSTAMSLFLAFWMKIQDSTSFGTIQYADQIFLILLLLVGMLSGLNGVRGRMENLPGVNGVVPATGGKGSGFLSKAFMGSSLLGQAFRNIKGNPLLKVTSKLASRGVTSSAKGTASLAKEGARITGNYLNQVDTMQNIRSRAKAGLPKSIQLFQPNQMQLTANMTQGSRDIFRNMVQNRMNPSNKKDLITYLKKNPHHSAHVMELTQWMQKRPYEQMSETPIFNGYMIPMNPPQKSTPEYMIWDQVNEFKNQYKLWLKAERNVRDVRWEKYKSEKINHDKSWLRRTLLKRPNWSEPSQREALQEYRRLLNAKRNNKRD